VGKDIVVFIKNPPPATINPYMPFAERARSSSLGSFLDDLSKMHIHETAMPLAYLPGRPLNERFLNFATRFFSLTHV
jgi:hypothetical protein